jgi:hypothetical protein
LEPKEMLQLSLVWVQELHLLATIVLVVGIRIDLQRLLLINVWFSFFIITVLLTRYDKCIIGSCIVFISCFQLIAYMKIIWLYSTLCFKWWSLRAYFSHLRFISVEDYLVGICEEEGSNNNYSIASWYSWYRSF